MEWTRSEAGELYRRHADRLWRALLLSTGRPEVASDAVAEAFAQAIRRWPELRDPMAWIWRTAYKVAAGELAASARSTDLDEVRDVTIPSTTMETFEALGALTPHQRAALVLHVYAGYSYREVAEILGSTVAAVGVHIHRAKQKAREAMEVSDA